MNSALAATLLVWPQLKTLGLAQALIWLIAPHMFLRVIGLSFLVPGVVSSSLPREWARPAAYGDLLAGVVRAGDGRDRPRRSIQAVCRPIRRAAVVHIVTAIVPPLLVRHALVFILLIRG